MIAIGLEEIMRKGRRVPECIGLIGNINDARAALSHCLPITLPPANPSGNRGRLLPRRYHTATIRPSRPSDDPPIHPPASLAAWLATILVIGNVPLRGVPGTHRCSGIPSRVLPYILKVSKDILIIRISGNQFVSQTRHHMATQISRPIFGPGPHKIIRQVSILGHAHVRGT